MRISDWSSDVCSSDLALCPALARTDAGSGLMAVVAQFDMVVRAWRDETERRKTDHCRRIETEFLPAALEATETPPSPVGRAIPWTIVIVTLLAPPWACPSMDGVFPAAEGRVLPRGGPPS